MVTRTDLKKFLGLTQFKSVRVKWLMADLHPWFPYQVPYYRSGTESSIHSLFLSRVPIDRHLPKGTMTSEHRMKKMKTDAPQTAMLTKGIYRGVPTEERIISYLALLGAGLIKP
jgi:hypothetical protein